jgi:hypothetical protein
LSDSCGFVDLGRPLWRDDGSAVCNCYWSSPAQSFLGPSPIGLVAIFYCLDSSLKVTVLKSITIPIFSYILSARTTHRKHSPSIVARRRRHRKHVWRVRLRVHWSVTGTGRSGLHRKQPDLLLRVGPCLQSCFLATRWSNPLHHPVFSRVSQDTVRVCYIYCRLHYIPIYRCYFFMTSFQYGNWQPMKEH